MYLLQKKDDIYHHGVKGQKWGVVNSDRANAAISRMKNPKKKEIFIKKLKEADRLYKNNKIADRQIKRLSNIMEDSSKRRDKLGEDSKEYRKLGDRWANSFLWKIKFQDLYEHNDKIIKKSRKQLDRTIRRALGESWF